MKKFNSVFLIVLLIPFSLIYLLGRSHGSNGKSELREQAKREESIIDSLNMELRIKEIELGRYEYVIDQLRESDSSKVDGIISNTE